MSGFWDFNDVMDRAQSAARTVFVNGYDSTQDLIEAVGMSKIQAVFMAYWWVMESVLWQWQAGFQARTRADYQETYRLLVMGTDVEATEAVLFWVDMRDLDDSQDQGWEYEVFFDNTEEDYKVPMFDDQQFPSNQ